jgi:hypothetical protein
MLARLLLTVFFLSSCFLQAALAAESDQSEKPSFPKYLLIDLTQQKAQLIEQERVIWESVASTGREGKATPPGIYKITDKHEKWISTIYKISMPYFQRFSHSALGIHAGPLPGYPGSAGCVRLPQESSKELFSLTTIGLPVVVQGEAPPFEHFRSKLRQAKKEKYSPYAKRGSNRLDTVSKPVIIPGPSS